MEELEEKFKKLWENLLKKVGPDGNDYKYWAKTLREEEKEPKYFHAVAIGESIFVENAKVHKESGGMSQEYKIGFKHFKEVALLYCEYRNGKKGIREKMRGKKMHKYNRYTSYLISLIHHFIEKELCE